MDPGQQFWWNWWVNLGVAVGTLLTVGVALFGEQARAKYFPPRLKLKVLRKEGEITELKDFSGKHIDDVRYFHLRIWNERRWSPVDGVQVYLIRVEEPGPSGALRVVWLGNVPIRWRDQEVVPLFRTIGAAADCDFCRVEKHGGLSLMPLIMPNNLNASNRHGKWTFAVSLQARSNQADSEVKYIQVSWDGQWEDGDTEMQRHLEVTELGSQGSSS